MNLAHVHTFLVVVETGNLNKAAAQLNVTQSTVTARINALEDLIGQKLLLRHRSGAALTATGARFLRHAEVMVQVWKQARYETSLPKGFEGVCAFGCDQALWASVGETWVNALRREKPTIAINVESGSESDSRGWLSNGMVDVAIAYSPPAAGGFSIDVLFEDVFIEVATEKRGLVRWDPSYVFVDLGEDFRREHAEAYPVDETAIVTFTNAEHALGHILAWGGSAYVPYRIARAHMKAGRLFEVEHAPRFRRTAYFALNSGRSVAWTWLPSVYAGFKAALAENTNFAGEL